MFGRTDSKRTQDAPTAELSKKPQAEDFTGDAVAKAVLKETLEHPATIYPAAGSALAVAWTLMIAASPTSVAFAVGCAFVGASAFIYNYVIKGPDRAAAYVAKLRELRRTHSLLELDQFARDCRKAGLREGFKSANDLKAAYQHITDYLATHKDGISADRFMVLAEDTFQEGTRILGQALAIYSAVETLDVPTLQNEIENWKTRRSTMNDNLPSSKALDAQIDSNTRQIALYTEQQSELTQLFAQVNEIETALQSTYVELVGLQNRNLAASLTEDGGAATRLKTAVDVARRVEQRLRGDDKEDQEKRDKYLKAYQQKNTLNSDPDPSKEEQQ
jgi:hypothetical protein